MVVNEDLDALKGEQLQIVGLVERPNEVHADRRVSVDVWSIVVLQVHRQKWAISVKELRLNVALWCPNVDFTDTVVAKRCHTSLTLAFDGMLSLTLK